MSNSISRLDQALLDRGLCQSREQAKRLVLAGKVRLNGRPAAKAGDRVRPADRLEVLSPERFVSRGGYKLEHALTHFHLEVANQTACDFGASTGGFTDCLLQHGARVVYAVDVGHGQLAWKLRHDPRVSVMERTNARHLAPEQFPTPFHPLDLAVIDCSFISLRLLLPAALRLLRSGGRTVALVKPQFEAGKEEASRGAGVITDPAIHCRVLEEIHRWVEAHPPWSWLGHTSSPLLGPAGNREFLVLLEKETTNNTSSSPA